MEGHIRDALINVFTFQHADVNKDLNAAKNLREEHEKAKKVSFKSISRLLAYLSKGHNVQISYSEKFIIVQYIVVVADVN